MKYSTRAVALVACLGGPCLWDSDTLDSELRGLPEAMDLVTGRWHRHGEVYYQKRAVRLARVEEPSLAQLDDLAVAYEHLDRRSEAIAVMARKHNQLLATPDSEHQYRYHANLGTFYAHDGRFDEALVELRRAIAINPDAHFGREIYQIELIEYVAAAKADPAVWARGSFLLHAGRDVFKNSFYPVLAGYGDDADWRGERELDWEQAYEAVGGMLRFGGLEGPELYRALGELFLAREHLHLAWWSFRRAIERGHPAADRLRRHLTAIEKHWAEAAKFEPGNVAPTEADYVAARASADRWLAAFHELEAAAAERGEDVATDAVLRRLLAAADQREPRPSRASPWSMLHWAWVVVLGGAVISLGLRLRRWRRPAAGAA